MFVDRKRALVHSPRMYRRTASDPIEHASWG
jgi:hypothetical protein